MTLFSANPDLHNSPADAPLQATHLGQAHIAGTGPDKKTCRECVHFGLVGEDWPDFFESGSKRGGLKQARCQYPINGKANRKFPHTARACRFFEQNEEAPPSHKPKGT